MQQSKGIIRNNKPDFFKLQKKPFLEKYYKGYFSTIVLQSIKNPEQYIDINEPVIFQNKRCNILKCDKGDPARISSNIFYLSYPFMLLFSYKFALAIYNIKIIKSLLWSALLFYTMKIRIGIKSNQEYIIKEINILENGKTCEILTLKNSFEIDINKIRKINFEEGLFMTEKLESLKSIYIPIVLDTKLYFIPKTCNISRKDFLSIICEGNYLKFHDILSDEKTIQL